MRHFVDSFAGLGKNAPKESLGIQAGWLRAALPSRPPLFWRYAPSSLRATRQRLSSSEGIYRKHVALIAGGQAPARDHLIELRSSKPAALRTADAGYHPRDFSLDLETRYLHPPGRQATLEPATGNVSPRSNQCSTTCGTSSRWIASHCAGGRKSMRNGSSTAWCATSRNWCIKVLVSRGEERLGVRFRPARPSRRNASFRGRP